MALDFTALGTQVRQMCTSLAKQTSEVAGRTARITQHYIEQTGNEAHWAQAVNLSRETATWLLSRPVERLDTVHSAPPFPSGYSLVASDGSQIERDRHGVASCYLINTGRVYLRYGAEPAARLTSQPTLYYQENDLYLSDGAKRIPIEGNYLSVRRDVEEILATIDLAREFLSEVTQAIAIQDGTLVRWTLAGAEKFVQQHFLSQYLGGLEELRQLGIPVASYISRPRATEMMGLIRLMYCPDVNVAENRGADCNNCSDIRAGRDPSCAICHGLVDADILASTLSDGQRGPLFISMSKINVESYGEHLVYFFYMRVGRELARIEIPRWVAQDREQVDLVHGIIYDQCVRGNGYPVALARAHEQAVIRAADRRTFQRMMEGGLLRAELPATISSKSQSKERMAL